jgi:hypothetical protein
MCYIKHLKILFQGHILYEDNVQNTKYSCCLGHKILFETFVDLVNLSLNIYLEGI